MATFRCARPGLILVLCSIGPFGCGWGTNTEKGPEHPYQGVKIVVGAVGDPAILTAVNAQKGEWAATRGAEINLRQDSIDPASMQGVDVVIFPGDRMGSLVNADALAVLPESVVLPVAPTDSESASEESPAPKPVDPLKFDDVVAAFRDQVSKYGKDRLALPHGGSALVLLYRREAFDREANRTAAKKDHLKLEPPETWSELDALAHFFQGRDWSGAGKPGYGIALALGKDAEGVGTSIFLARAAALGQHRDQYSFLFDSDSMEPRVDSPPFVESLRSLIALKADGPPGMETFDAQAARTAFRKGDVAMLIDRAERAAQWSGGGLIGVAQLPGSERVFDPARKLWETAKPLNRPSYLPHGGGWLVGISRSASGRQREAAIDFAKYVISPETSALMRADRAIPVLPVRAAQLGQGLPDPQSAPGVESRQWSAAVSRTLNAERVVPGLRIPGTEAYLADLDKGRAAAARGEPAERALKSVVADWSKRTKDLGTERQLWHYRRSLNSLVTTPTPPAK